MSTKYKNWFKKFLTALSIGMLMTVSSPVAQGQADTQAPAEEGVKNLKVKETGDKEVTLTWDVATDNVGVKGYYVYHADKSVILNADKDEYDQKIDAGNVITYTVTGLTNDTKYYFAVTAYDAAGNESDSYSNEVSATPKEGSGAGSSKDTTSPTVALASSVNQTTVKVVFSEKVKLPATNPATAFNIKDVISETLLVVKDATIDSKDPSGKTVILETGKQEKNKKYELTVGISITDESDNPIKSGTSDTAVFTGSDTTEEKAAAEEQLTLMSANVIDAIGVELKFSTAIRLGVNPVDNFIIAEKEDSKNRLGIKSVRLNTKDESKVLLVTEPQKNVEYVVIASDITDADGNLIDLNKNTAQFKGVPGSDSPKEEEPKEPTEPEEPKEEPKEETPGEDKTAPAAVTKLVANPAAGDSLRLSWVASTDSDVEDQMLYISIDGGKTYDRGRSIGKTASAFDVKGLEPKTQYTFKITAKDAAGNESNGATVVYTSPELPGTGPGMGVILAGSFLSAYAIQRRRKNTPEEI